MRSADQGEQSTEFALDLAGFAIMPLEAVIGGADGVTITGTVDAKNAKLGDFLKTQKIAVAVSSCWMPPRHQKRACKTKNFPRAALAHYRHKGTRVEY